APPRLLLQRLPARPQERQRARVRDLRHWVDLGLRVAGARAQPKLADHVAHLRQRRSHLVWMEDAITNLVSSERLAGRVAPAGAEDVVGLASPEAQLANAGCIHPHRVGRLAADKAADDRPAMRRLVPEIFAA